MAGGGVFVHVHVYEGPTASPSPKTKLALPTSHLSVALCAVLCSC